MLIMILLKQIAVMAMLIALGLFLCRKGMLTPQGTKELGAVLLKVVIPCVIVKAYITEVTPEKMHALVLSFFYALVMYIIAMVLSMLIYGRRDRMSNVGAAFCNAGFIGIPLVQAVIGDHGVFYIASSIAFLNIFQWTYGIYMMTDKKEAISFKTISRNPVVIALVIGLVLFFARIPVPQLIVTTLGYVAGMNTPVAMILIGSYMAKISPKAMLNVRAAVCSLCRLIVIPLVTILIMKFLPGGDREVLMAVLLTGITPIGANICVFAQMYDNDYEYSVIAVCLSTLLSVATVPVLFSIADKLI